MLNQDKGVPVTNYFDLSLERISNLINLLHAEMVELANTIHRFLFINTENSIKEFLCGETEILIKKFLFTEFGSGKRSTLGWIYVLKIVISLSMTLFGLYAAKQLRARILCNRRLVQSKLDSGNALHATVLTMNGTARLVAVIERINSGYSLSMSKHSPGSADLETQRQSASLEELPTFLEVETILRLGDFKLLQPGS